MSEFDVLYNRTMIEKKKIYNREVLSKKAAKRRYKEMIFTFIIIIVLFIFFVTIVNGYARINEVKYQNFELKRHLNNLSIEVNEINSKINENIDLKQVEKYAIEYLGMVYPSENQLQKIQVVQNYSLSGTILASNSNGDSLAAVK